MKKIFLALPSMNAVNPALFDKLAWFSMQEGYAIAVGRTVNEHFHDSARNKLCLQFLDSGCDWLLFLDADIDPSPAVLKLADHDKDICAAHVFAWMNARNPEGELTWDLYSSIWDRSDCEECKAVAQFQKDGSNKDQREYRILPEATDILQRWNPWRQQWQAFYSRRENDGGVFLQRQACRCEGTGKDPLVYRASKKIMQPQPPIRVDAVGAAAMMVHRRVIEGMQPPWFQFLYREMRDVMVTEDLLFCYKAGRQGFEVWADQTIPCRHFKEVDLLSMNNWAARLVERAKKQEEKPASRIIVPGFSGAFR